MRVRFFFFLLFVCISARSEPRPAEIERIIAGAAKSGVSAGIWVKDLTHRKVLIERSPKQPLSPASITKILTSSVALEILGPEKRFETHIFLDGGSIYIEGRGDPFFVEEKLGILARKIKLLIQARSGMERPWELVALPGFFDDDSFGGGRGRRNSDQPYNAGVSDLAFNFNSIEFTLAPGVAAGTPIEVQVTPDLERTIVVVNRAQTGGKTKTIQIDRGGSGGGKERFVISGNLPLGSPSQSIYRRVQEPRLFALEAIKEALEREGVKIQARVRVGEPQESARFLKSEPALNWKSEPLTDLLRGMNRYSNNFMAEQLTKILGAEVNGVPGNYEKGSSVLEHHLEQLGIPHAEFKITNGSGLTNENRISARAMGAVLENAWANGGVLSDLWSSFAMPGGPGSLEKRIDAWDLDPKESRRIRAKTGTLTQGVVVASLGGYLVGRDATQYAFTAILNQSGSNDEGSTLHRFQDSMGKMMKELLQW